VIHLVDAETKHPIRKDVDDMRCTPRKAAGEWSPQDGVDNGQDNKASSISLVDQVRNGHMARTDCLARAASPSYGEIAHSFPRGASSQHPSARVRRQTTWAGATCR
jgi:hypothetical protein